MSDFDFYYFLLSISQKNGQIYYLCLYYTEEMEKVL